MIDFIKMFFDHCGYRQYDYQITESKINKFCIHHELGKKGSLFLKEYVETVVKDILGIAYKSIVTDNAVTMIFKK